LSRRQDLDSALAGYGDVPEPGLFAILANRDHRLPTMLASQTGPAHWVGELPDRIAADSIVNRLANRARTINLGDIDMRKRRHDQTHANQTYWE
jgi:hypothetical protein